MKKCVICQASAVQAVFTENNIDIVRCRNCGHIFSAYEQEQDYSGYYGERIADQENFWWNAAHQRMYADFCQRFIAGKSGRLLDVGCGLGFFVKKAGEYANWEAAGYEISQPAVKYAQDNLGLANIFCGRVEEANFPAKYFDIITLWDVIEHIPDPAGLLRYLRAILRDSGMLFIHTPNIKIQLPKAKIKRLFDKNCTHLLEAKDHINNYSAPAIKRLLEQHGFKDIKFIHLHPIQSMAGSKSLALKYSKNLWFYFSVLVFYASLKKINLDNLFVVAKK